MERLIRRAGLTPWPRLLHNLRASRETELAAEFPLHVVIRWLGNAPRTERHPGDREPADPSGSQSGDSGRDPARDRNRPVERAAECGAVALQSAHVGGCHGLTAQSKTPVLTGVYANPDKRSQPLSRSEDGEDRSSTTPENPEKTALFESGAAECGAVAVDAANEAGIFHELSLVVDAWPSLNTEIRAALLAMVRTCLDRQSDASKSD
ncbi:MAG TPA: hypothetical protein VMY42_03825 [Thermoguttaceae bacterium]|nr:hypothetical protein [Thermoguttaceae bacterium]